MTTYNLQCPVANDGLIYPRTIELSGFVANDGLIYPRTIKNIAPVVIANFLEGVPSPVFSQQNPIFYRPFSLSISCLDPHVNIYYTLDGTMPTSSSTLYTEPFEISATTNVSAVAIDNLSSISSPVNSVIYTEGENMFKIVSRDYGTWTNGINVTLTRDAAADATLVNPSSVSYVPATCLVSYVPQRLSYSYRIRNGITIANATGAKFAVGGTNSLQFIYTNAAGKSDITDMLATPTLQDLVNWLNQHDSVQASVIGPAYYPSCILDYNAGTVAQPDGNAYFYQSEECALAYMLWAMCPLVTPLANYTAPASPTPGNVILPTPQILDFVPTLVLTMFAAGFPGPLPNATHTGLTWTYNLTGGLGSKWDDIASDTTGLTNALLLAETTQCAYIWVQSVAKNVQNLLLLHAETMSSETREKYRIYIAGANFIPTSPVDDAYLAAPDVNTAVSAVAAVAPTLNGPVVLCFNGAVTPNPISGNPEQLGGLGLASQILGMCSGMSPGQPLTNKEIAAQGLEFPTVLDSQLDSLLQAGVLTPYYSEEDGTYNVLQALTCYQTNDPSFRLLLGLRIQHTVCRLWISVLSKFKGAPLDLETGERIKIACAKALDDSILSGSNPDGFLTQGKVNGTTTPAWNSLQVTGDTATGVWKINVNVCPVGETDYILVKTKFLPTIIQLS